MQMVYCMLDGWTFDVGARAGKKGNVMNLITEQVQHSRFGLGTILEQTASTIEVRFDGAFGVKKFNYPSAFESFLVLCRPVLKESMDQELTQIREQNETERRRQIEAEKLHDEAVRALLAQHIAAKKTPKPRAVKAKKAAKTAS
jgi:hypothetical protein